MVVLKSLIVWLCFIPVAILNGGLREYVLVKVLGEKLALPASGIILSTCIFLIAWWLLPRVVKVRGRKDCWLIGICWVLLTVAFEFASGLAGGNTAAELLAAYNPLTGNLWLLVLATVLLSPLVVNFQRMSPAYRVRPLTEHDIPQMQALFRDTVLAVNSKDYTKEEAEDWASCGDSGEHWRKLLSENSFIAALDAQGRIVGFSSMNAGGHLHSMFVHKDWQGRGIASLLLSEVEKMAREYGVRIITVEASITSLPFFEKRGYKVVKEQKAKARRLYLTNYVMDKRL